MLGDCVWFLMRFAKMFKDHRKAEIHSKVLHKTLLILNKYVVKLGLEASLIAKDRFLVVLACLFIAGKA